MIRLAIRCRPEQAEAVLAELAVLAPSGVEESREGELVEYAIYGGPGEIPQLGEIEAAVGGALVEVDSREVADDWSERWRAFHKPVLVGGRVLVRPPWADPREESNSVDVVIDPGQAFGTGAHPTTRLCLEALIDWLDSAERSSAASAAPSGDAAAAHAGLGPLCDLGAGSGVLAIAAAKLGFSPVAAYDHDPAAVAAAHENAAANGVEIESHRADLRAGLPPLAPITVANLMAPLLIELAPLFAAAESPELLICSGILPEQADAVRDAFAAAGFTERSRATDTGWASLTLVPG